MNLKKIVFAICVLYSFHNAQNLDHDFFAKNYYSSSSIGKGGTGISSKNDVLGATLNPASLDIKKNVNIAFEYMFKKSIKGQFTPIYFRTFDNEHPTFIAGVGLKIIDNMNLGLIYNIEETIIDTSFSTRDARLRDPNYAHSFRESKIDVFLNYDFKSYLKIGLTVSYVDSESNTETPSFGHESDYDFSRMNFKFGIQSEVINNFRIGAYFSPQIKTDVKTKSLFEGRANESEFENIDLMSYGIGMSYLFEKMPLELLFDYNYIDELEDRIIKYDSKWNLSFGGEYKFFNDLLQLRLGLSYFKNHYEIFDDQNGLADNRAFVERYQLLLTGGIGAKLDFVNINLSIRDSYQTESNFGKVMFVNLGVGVDV